MNAGSWSFRLLELYGTRIHHRGHWWTHLHLRRLLGADVDADLEVVRDGLKWVLNPSDFTQAEFFWTGSWEGWDTYHLKRMLTPGGIFFDIGANFGYYAITLAAALARQCHVHAFEPFPVTYRRLRRNIELNCLQGVVEAHDVALQEQAGTGYMRMKPGNSGTAWLDEDPRGEAVATTTLSAFCGERAVSRIDLVKLDVEGSEERVLRGGADVISTFKPLLVVELNPGVLARAGSSPEVLINRLHSLGYDLFVAARDALVPLAVLPTGPTDYVNAFCTPSRRMRP
jgi:FkbM family methyltransferase